MKLGDFVEQLKEDEEYQAASKELKPILDLADDILRLRLMREWSQSELARCAGTKQANVSRIEAGLGNPTLRFIRKVATALGAELIIRLEPFDSEAKNTPSMMDELIELVEQLFSQTETTNASGTSGPEAEVDHTAMSSPPTPGRPTKECA